MNIIEGSSPSVSQELLLPVGAPPHLELILEKIGPAVLLPVLSGVKGSRTTGWHKKTLADMRDPAYIHLFAASTNVAVLLGVPSNYLCSIDVDSDEDGELLLSLNSKSHVAFRSRARRAFNVWMRVRGPYPGVKQLCHRTRKDEKGRPMKVGEWRATGGQTMIYGIHPDGMNYEWECDAPPSGTEL